MNEVLATVQTRSNNFLQRGGHHNWILWVIAAAVIIALIAAFTRNRHRDDDRRDDIRTDRSVRTNSLRTEFAEDDHITEKELQNHLREQERRHDHDEF